MRSQEALGLSSQALAETKNSWAVSLHRGQSCERFGDVERGRVHGVGPHSVINNQSCY